MKAADATMLLDAINEALSGISIPGFEIVPVDNCRYGSTEATFKVRVVHGAAGDIERRDYALFAPQYGIPADSFGKKIMVCGKLLTLSGVRPRAIQYPFTAKNAAGKSFKLRVYQVADGLGIKRDDVLSAQESYREAEWEARVS